MSQLSRDAGLIAIDLFAGAGGLSLGLKRAGFTVAGAVEVDDLAAETYRKNHPKVDLRHEDIRGVDPDQWRKALGLEPGELAVLAGCPPCQGFSSIRTKRKGTITDHRNDLILEFLRFVDGFRPRAVMLENVPDLLGDSRLRQIERRLRRRGYSVTTVIRDAASFGVPQRRRRLIMVALRGQKPELPIAAPRRRSVKDAIGRMSPPEPKGDPLHMPDERRSERIRRLIALIPKDGGSRSALPVELTLSCHTRISGFHDVYGRMKWAEPAPTITGGCVNPSKGRFLHPSQNRAITLREAARLQGFPPRYYFSLRRGKYRAAEMIGNAFPPRFAEVHAARIAEQIRTAVANSAVSGDAPTQPKQRSLP